MANKGSESFEIDTKGVCLFCLQNCPDEKGNSHRSRERTSTVFRMLMRYLKIDIFKYSHFSSPFMESADNLGNVRIFVQLCQDCFEESESFCEFFEEFERIRMQLDKCIQSLHRNMREGKENKSRLMEFRKRMITRNPLQLFNNSIVENVRKETLRECSQRMDTAVPRISLSKGEHSMVNFLSVTTSASSSLPKRGPASQKKMVKGKPGSKLSAPEKILAAVEEPSDSMDSMEDQFADNSPPEGYEEAHDDVQEIADDLKFPTSPPSSTFANGVKNESSNSSTSNLSRSKLANASTKLRCKWCSASFKTKSLLQLHNRVHARQTLICKYCPTTFRDIYDFKQHQTSKHTMELLSKDLPPGTTRDQLENAVQQLINTKKRDSTNSKKLVCLVCMKGFPKTSQLRIHLLRFHLQKVIEILPENDLSDEPFCSDEIVTVKNTTVLETEANEDGSTSFLCSMCGKRFRYKMTLNRHLKLHTGEFDYACKYCKRGFSQNSHLHDHEKLLHPLLKFSAELPHGTTEDQFKTGLKTVTANMEISEDEKIFYKCNYCQKSIGTDKNMKLHIVNNHIKEFISEVFQSNDQGGGDQSANGNIKEEMVVNSGSDVDNDNESVIESDEH